MKPSPNTPTGPHGGILADEAGPVGVFSQLRVPPSMAALPGRKITAEFDDERMCVVCREVFPLNTFETYIHDGKTFHRRICTPCTEAKIDAENRKAAERAAARRERAKRNG